MKRPFIAKAWHVLFVILWSSIGLYAAFLAFLLTTKKFDGVDGGIGFAVGIIYGIFAVVTVGVIHGLYWVTRRWYRTNAGIFFTVVGLLLISAVALSILLIKRQTYDARVRDITPLISKCSVQEVRWQYSPSLVTVTYNDGSETITKKGYIQHGVIGSFIAQTEKSCGSSIKYYINDELTDSSH